jgi:DNA polymerase III subunit delta'
MLDSLIFGDEVKLFLKNELRQNKEAGTYLFYGDKGIDLLGLAMSFTMAMNCPELENNYCGVCEVCKKIKHGTYADLEIVGLQQGESKVGIDKIKNTIYKASSSSYEGRKKVFIIKDIESMNKYSANALLKIIEEPPKGTFFILVSNTLNVLPTILSRSIVVKVNKPSAEDLGVTEKVYNFLMGNMDEILEWKEERFDLNEIKSYSALGEYLNLYLAEKKLKYKIDLLKGVDDYIYNVDRIKKSEKLSIVFGLLSILQDEKLVENKSHERKIVEELMHIFIVRLKTPKYTEKLIELKQGLRHNINTQAALTLFFMSF